MLAAPVAARATGGTATERAAQAQTACLTGDYAKGVAILAELYVSTRNAIYIFNQGRCFEQNGKYEEAILRFREYQRKNAAAGQAPDPVAAEHIADCQALWDKQKAAPPAAPGPAAGAVAAPAAPVETQPPMASPPPLLSSTARLPADAPSPVDTPTHQVDLSQTTPAPSEAQSETSILGRWWFWTGVGTLVAGGVIAGLLLSRDRGDHEVFCPDCNGTGVVNLP